MRRQRRIHWRLTGISSADLMKSMESCGLPLREYVNQQIYYGMKTGCDAAFIIDGVKREELITQDPKSAEIIKALATGKDVQRWVVN